MRWGFALWLVAASSTTSRVAAEQEAAAVEPSRGREPLLNPFLTEEERRPAPQATLSTPPPVQAAEPLTALPIRVEAIFYSPDPSKSSAVVEGQIVKPGDRIRGKRVMRIEREAIVVADGGSPQGELVVPLDGIAASTWSRAQPPTTP